MREKDDGELRLVWLEAFVAAVELKSYSLVSRRLGVTQPSITRYMQALQEWSRRLLIAHAHPVHLTPDGEAFLPIAKDLVERLRQCRATLPVNPIQISKKTSAKDIRP